MTDLLLYELAPGMLAHASGALWLPEISTVVVADLHLGYGFAQRRRGQLGPILDDQASAKLDAVISHLSPATIVFLGDLVHAPGPSAVEKAWIRERLAGWGRSISLLLVRGNHDRAFEVDFADLVQLCENEMWRAGGIIAVHGDREWPRPAAGETLIVGHFHPAIGIDDSAGARQRMPLFLHAPGSLVILPAFSPFAAGSDIRRFLPSELQSLEDGLEAVAATGKRAVPLGSITRVLAVSASDGSTSRDFQRLRYKRN